MTKYYIYGKISKIIYYVTTDETKANKQFTNYQKHYRHDEIILYKENGKNEI